MRHQSEFWLSSVTAPSREMSGWVDVYRDSTLAYTFEDTGNLASVKIENTTESGGLFGYTLCQKATIEVLDKDNTITVNKDDRIEVWLGVMLAEETREMVPKPSFYVEEVTRNETNGNITIVAYDVMNKAVKHKQKEMAITYPINLAGYASQVATILGTSTVWEGSTFTYHSYTEELPPNFSGEETLRDVLNDIAEVTGTICFVDYEDKIHFKSLKKDSVLNITKADYFEFKLGTAATISQVTHATALGDNLTAADAVALTDVSAGTTTGYNAIIRDNAFISLREDAATIVEQILNYVNGLTFYAYDLKWRGNPALDVGDKVTVTLKDDSTVDIYYLGESLLYNGGMVATATWQHGEVEDVDSNPTTIGEAINQTFAKVDKVNQQITIYAGSIEANAQEIALLQIDTGTIKNSVSSLTTLVEEGQAATDASIKTLEEKVETTMTKDDFTIEIKNILSDGVERVETATGYVFDEEGLTISKSTSDVSTQITEDGMTVSRDGEIVLQADNEGVKAEDLHATTFLIIGDYARFEEFEENGETRIGCFWIG
jgi:hypothetical protein